MSAIPTYSYKICDCGGVMEVEHTSPLTHRPNKIVSARRIDFALNGVGDEFFQCSECGLNHSPLTFKATTIRS